MTAALDDRDRARLAQWWAACRARRGALPEDVTPVQSRLVRSVGRGQLPSGAAVYLKVMAFPRPVDRLRYLLRPLPARHEARMLEVARAAGVRAPEPLAVWTTRRLGLPELSVLVTRGLPVHGGEPSLAAMVELARALADAGIEHLDLHRGNFVRLDDGSAAVLDFQSTRQRGRVVGGRGRRRMAARILEGHGGVEGRELAEAGLVAPGELGAVRARARSLRNEAQRRRILRCLRTSTEFVRSRRGIGRRHARRGPWPEGRWVAGGTDLVRAWIGDRALEVLDGRRPRLHALFRKSWWFPGKHSVYDPAGGGPPFEEVLPALLEGYQRFKSLAKSRTSASPSRHGGC